MSLLPPSKVPISSCDPPAGITAGDVLGWDGTQWVAADGAGTVFLDTQFLLQNHNDVTGTVNFDCTGITGGTNISIYVPDGAIRLPWIFGTSGNLGCGQNAIETATSCVDCTGFGIGAFSSITTGDDNCAFGKNALNLLTSGSYNTGIGSGTLVGITDGTHNTAVGCYALNSALTGNASYNTAVGFGTMRVSTAYANSAFGYNALTSNTTGGENTAIGYQALRFITDGASCTAVGYAVLENATNTYNTGLGTNAGNPLTTGQFNTLLGSRTGATLTTGSNNVLIGDSANVGAAGTANSIIIGQGVASTASNQIRIGGLAHTTCFIRGIRGIATGAIDAVAVLVDSNGQLGTISSSQRFKENIADIGDLSSKLYGLRPVTFNYKADESKKLTYGLIAEEVLEVIPDIVVRNLEGEIETVQYHLLIPLMLDLLIKQGRRIAELSAELSA